MSTQLITIIVPVYNSRKFLNRLLQAIEEERIKNKWNLELLLIDDGSNDNSFDEITNLSSTYKYIRGIKLSRNFGHQAAVKTGLEFCLGDYIAIIDDDLQDPPSLLPYFFSFLDKDYDVVYGVRKKRKEKMLKRASYNLFYRFMKRVSEIDIPLDSGDFCVMKKQVVQSMLLLREKSPYLRGIRSWVGFRQIGVEYERSARIEGESGYTLAKLLKIASDGIFSFSSLPIRFLTYLGLFSLSVSLMFGLYVLFNYFFLGISSKGYASTIILILFFGSINLISVGILGEYVIRIYAEGKDRPISVIEKTINI